VVNYEELQLKHVSELKKFLDIEAGIDYLTEEDLIKIIKNKITLNNKNCSFVALDNDKIIGVRLTYAPKKWLTDAKGITVNKWNVDEDYVAKFHCLFLDSNYQGQGIGPEMSKRSIKVLKEMGTKAIICHSWLESPNNSSQRYLLKYGFKPVSLHKNFWSDFDYLCSGCSKKPCVCTAEEMIFYIN
jgi:ribosomal protein S18 acetylase RimI-like enzyme